MAKIKLPKKYKGRMKDVGKKHNLGSADDVFEHFIGRGLKKYDVPADLADRGAQMEHVVDEEGYSSVDELVEHLVLRGLNAYEEAADDPAALEARLRGLGYID